MPEARISRAWTLFAFASGLVVGAGIVRLFGGPEPLQAEPPVPPDPRRPASLVCENVPLSGGPSPVSNDLGLRFCLSQLEAANQARRRVIQPWPEPDDPMWAGELPDEWTASMERVLHDCDLPGELVLTDCSEPPCTAVFRDAEWSTLEGALGDCPSFRAAFPRPELEPVPFVVPCGDGRFETMVLVTTFTEEQRQAWFEELGLTEAMESYELSPLFEGYRIMARRADGLVPFWECADP